MIQGQSRLEASWVVASASRGVSDSAPRRARQRGQLRIRGRQLLGFGELLVRCVQPSPGALVPHLRVQPEWMAGARL